METLFAVTLTGRVRAGVAVEDVWTRAAGLLRKTSETFASEVRARMPLSLRPVDEVQAQRQAAALAETGLEVAVAPERGARVWLHHEGRVCGPLSAVWLRQALDAGAMSPAQTRVRGLAPDAAWIAATDWLRGEDLDLALDTAPAGTRPAATHADAPHPLLQPDAVARPLEQGGTPAPGAADSGVCAPASLLDPGSAGTSGASPGSMLPLHVQRSDLYGGFWMRFAAAILDMLIFNAGFLFVAGLASAITAAPFVMLAGWDPVLSGYAGLRVLMFFVNIISTWLYAALFQSSRLQASPGMLALGLRVTTLEGERIGFGRATGRYFSTILSALILCFGYFMIGWTQRKQALHDMIAGTLVVRKDGLARYRSDVAAGTAASSAYVASGLSAGAIAGIVIAVLFSVLVSVTAIIAAIAIPAYQNYIIRSQIAEGLSLSDAAKTAVAEFYGNTGHFPGNNASAGLAQPASISGSYVVGVAVRDGGEVIVQYGNRANPQIAGHMIALAPTKDGGSISWTCETIDVPQQYLPRSCRQ